MEKKWIVIPWISLSFLLFGMLLCFCSIIDCEIGLKRHLLFCVLISGGVLFCVLQLKRKYALLCTAVGMLGMTVLILLNMEKLWADFLALVYYVNKRSVEYSKSNLVDIEGVWGDMDSNLLLLLIGILLALFISFFAFRLRTRYYGLLPVYGIPAFGLCIGAAPDKKAVLVTAIGAVMAFAWISYQEKGGRRCFVQKKASGEKSRAISYVILSAVLVLGLLGAQFFEKRTNTKILEHSDRYLERQHNLEQKLTDTVEKVAQVISGKLGMDSDGRLSNERPYYTNQAVLQITSSKKPTKPFYLKGFVGGEYQNGVWEPCETEKLKEIVSGEDGEKYIWNVNYVFAETEFLEHELMQLQIHYINNGKRLKYAYMPYYSDVFSAADDKGESGISFDGENGILRTGDFYSVFCYNLGEEMNELAKHAEDEEVWATLGLSSVQADAYYEYIQSVYGTLPEEGLRQLKSFAEAYRYGTENAISVAQIVRNILREKASYSKNLEPVPRGKDYVEYFLFSQHKGYCEHFATAGTLLVRAKGIPARYVSGYKLSPDRFIDNGDGTYTAKVLDSDAHAWTEVYAGRVKGWFPIEMTPGADAQSQNSTVDLNPADLETTPEAAATQTPAAAEASQSQKPTDTPEATPEATIDATEAPEATAAAEVTGNERNNGSKTGGQKLSYVRLAAILFVVILWIIFAGRLVFLRIQVKRYDRELRRTDGDRNAYIRVRTARLLYFLRRCGIQGLAGHESQWIKVLEKECANEYDEWLKKMTEVCEDELDAIPWQSFLETIQKAEYARDSVSPEEYNFFCSMVRRVEQTFYEKQGKIRRWYLRAIGLKS